MLKDVFALATEKLRTAPAVREMPSCKLGEEHLPSPGGCPAIVWVPGRGPISGGRQAIDQESPGNPRALFQRNLGINAYVYAESFNGTEALLGHFVAALHAALPGRWTPTSESWSMGWPVGTVEPMAHAESGTLCILSFDVRLPLFDEANPEVTPDGMAITGNFVTVELS